MYGKPCLTILAILLLLTQCSYAQSINRQDVGFLAGNILFGGIVTGTGSLINKKKQEKPLPAFWQGFKYGCIGGALTYTGKKFNNFMQQGGTAKTILGGWGGKLVHNTGASIMENASLRQRPFAHYNLYIGFVRVEMDWNGPFKVQPKLLPVTLASMVYCMAKFDDRFDAVTTLKTGTLFFKANKPLFNNTAATTIRSNVSVYNTPYSDEYVRYLLGHENTHALQSQEYYVFNTYLHKPATAFRNKHKTFAALSKYLYLDANLLDLSYEVAKSVALNQYHCYISNPYELEADYMSLNTYIKKCK